MGFLDTAMQRIDEMVADRLKAVAPFRAAVTGNSNGMVTIRRLEALTGESELRARLPGPAVAVNDEVICLMVNGKPVVLGPVQRGAPTALFPPHIIPFTFRSDAAATVTNTATYASKATQSVALPDGTWGCVIRCSALCWRSVASGEKLVRFEIGGLSHEVVTFTTASGAVMTTGHTMSGAINRTATSNPIVITGGATFDAGFSYRGGTTAGNTTISFAEMSGFFYRIPA